MAGPWLTIKSLDGAEFKGYLALPEAGRGPGLVLLPEMFAVNSHIRKTADLYAQKGYVVLAPDIFWRLEPCVELDHAYEDRDKGLAYLARLDEEKALADVGDAVTVLRSLPACDGKVGIVGFCMGGKLAFRTAARAAIDAVVAYYPGGLEKYLKEAVKVTCPIVMHFGEMDRLISSETVAAARDAVAEGDNASVYLYPDAGHGFYCDERPEFIKPAAGLAHSRTIAVLREAMGPRYDLSAIWEKHCRHEFEDGDLEAALATMVDDAYVNHVPTMTGAVGKDRLRQFYRDRFIAHMPEDTKIIVVSRTVGADRLVDEMLFSLPTMWKSTGCFLACL